MDSIERVFDCVKGYVPPMDPLVKAAVAAVKRRGENPVNDREAKSAEVILSKIVRLARPFDEHADPVHITASALITGPRGVILLKHRKLGIWVQPGGHVDPGETPAEAAVREACEETGLAVTLAEPELAQVDVHPGPRGHTHLDMRFLCTAPDDDPCPPTGESQDVYWFDWPTAIDMADDGIAGLLRSRQPET